MEIYATAGKDVSGDFAGLMEETGAGDRGKGHSAVITLKCKVKIELP
jgi:hypothetical protein